MAKDYYAILSFMRKKPLLISGALLVLFVVGIALMYQRTQETHKKSSGGHEGSSLFHFVTMPKKNDQWKIGSTHSIIWDIGSIQIEKDYSLLLYLGHQKIAILTGLKIQEGKYDWTILNGAMDDLFMDIVPGKYRVSAVLYNGPVCPDSEVCFYKSNREKYTGKFLTSIETDEFQITERDTTQPVKSIVPDIGKLPPPPSQPSKKQPRKPQRRESDAVLKLYQAGKMKVLEQMDAPQLRARVLKVAFPTDLACSFFYGGEKICAFLLVHQDGRIEYLKSATAEEIVDVLPEGLLLREEVGDAGNARVSYSLLDLSTKKSQVIGGWSATGGDGCGQNTYELQGQGLSLKILMEDEDDQCHPFPKVQALIFSGEKEIEKIFFNKPFSVEFDAVKTFRNRNKFFFSLKAKPLSRRFVYDGTVTPPRLLEVNEYAR